MQAGDRVLVKKDVERWGGLRGFIEGKPDNEPWFEADWLIRCDDGTELNMRESELLPVEVAVLEGAVTFEFDNGLVVGGTPIFSVIDHGDEARITIERVKTDPPDETPG